MKTKIERSNLTGTAFRADDAVNICGISKNNEKLTGTKLSAATIEAIASAIAGRLNLQQTSPLLPEGRATLNEAEAAAFLGIGMDFLRQLRQDKKIDHRKIGRRIVYTALDLHEFLDQCRS